MQNDHVLTVYTFFGSTTFLALIFLLQSTEKIRHYEYFIGVLAVTTILFLLLVVARLNISRGYIGENTNFARIVGLFGIVGFTLIVFTLVLYLMLEINFMLGLMVGVVSFAFYIILVKLANWERIQHDL